MFDICWDILDSIYRFFAQFQQFILFNFLKYDIYRKGEPLKKVGQFYGGQAIRQLLIRQVKVFTQKSHILANLLYQWVFGIAKFEKSIKSHFKSLIVTKT